MNSEKGVLHKEPRSVLGAVEDDNPNALSTRGLLRLLMPPAIATVLFIGGVYWVRLQAHSGAPGQDAPSIVQVQLLPRPNPVPTTPDQIVWSSPP
jgi:protein TonB